LKVNVIGSGFAGLTSAALTARAGHEVHVFEKNNTPGGRARQFHASGFVFDMGPSWYWMPDVFENFFQHFGKTTSDYYDLTRLDPAFKIFFPGDEVLVPDDRKALDELFERFEPGSSARLESFLKDGAFKYEVGVKDIIYRQPDGLKPFLDWKIVKSAAGLQLFTSIGSQIRKYFSHPYLIQLLEFPVLFLGTDPKNTPALYSLMDYAGLSMGTWYPHGGFVKIVEGMKKVAEEQGVTFHFNHPVSEIVTEKNKASHLVNETQKYQNDALIIAGDYHHFDSQVLPEAHRQYSARYWEKRTMSPSTLLYYVGHKGKIEGLEHHNLFFDADFQAHSNDIYTHKKFPEDPLFYVCCPSKTDATVAPEGHENLFVLIPIAAGLEDTPELQEKYFQIIADRIQSRTGTDIRENIVYRRDYATTDFIKDYHAYRGNAYGLANTLRQTAFLKPSMKHKTLKNVFFAGQLTVPGPGVPPSIVSGELAANYINSLS